MKTDTSERGLETLIMRHMTGVDGQPPGLPDTLKEFFKAASKAP